MSVTSQPTVNYVYDASNRLVQLTQQAGSSNGGQVQRFVFAYDAVGRRTQVSYGNGVKKNITYDEAGQPTAISYINADASIIGDLVYGYSAEGQITSVGGSMSHVVLPDELTSVEIDANNRLNSYNGQSLTYDLNGNMTTEGGKTYVWNVRDQLVAIKDNSGVVLSSFSYDAFGRRQTKNVSGKATGFVYDGFNLVQELIGDQTDNSSSNNVLADYIFGGLDEVLARTTKSNNVPSTFTYLTDVIGSVMRLTDIGGNKVVDYSYTPFGATSADGWSDNPIQFAGRENDSNGLYFFRTRYYSPSYTRFISSDSIGLRGGLNSYAYADSNPISNVDPFGRAALGAMIGRTVGGLTGRAVGGAVGSAIPVAGTAAGGFAGGFVGSRVGGYVGSTLEDMIKAANKYGDDDRGGQCRMKNAPRGDGKNMPGDPQRQNKQTDDAAAKAGLNDKERAILHQEVSGRNYDYNTIREIAMDIKSGKY